MLRDVRSILEAAIHNVHPLHEVEAFGYRGAPIRPTGTVAIPAVKPKIDPKKTSALPKVTKPVPPKPQPGPPVSRLIVRKPTQPTKPIPAPGTVAIPAVKPGATGNAPGIAKTIQKPQPGKPVPTAPVKPTEPPAGQPKPVGKEASRLAQVKSEIAAAAGERKMLSIIYGPKLTNGDTVKRMVEPYSYRVRRLASGGYGTFLFAYHPAHKSIEMYLLKYIQAAGKTNRSFSPRWPVEIGKYKPMGK